MPTKTTLSPRREKFAFEVARGLSKTRAAVRAGYSPRSAASMGCQLAQITAVADRIQQLRESGAASAPIETVTPDTGLEVVFDASGRLGVFVPASLVRAASRALDTDEFGPTAA